MVEIDALETSSELLLGNVLDVRTFLTMNKFYTMHNFKTVLCLDETQWVTYDFDNERVVPLELNIQINKPYSQFTANEKFQWQEAVDHISLFGFDAKRLQDIDWGSIKCGMVRIACVLDASYPIFNYEYIGGTTVIHNGATMINNKIHSMYNQNLYIWDGTQWQTGTKCPYSFNQYISGHNGIYALSSSNASYKSYFYFWDGTTWNKLTNVPMKLGSGVFCSYKNEFHVMGSSEQSSTYQTHYKWDGVSWTKIGSDTLPFSVGGSSSFATMEYNDCLYVFKTRSVYKWDGTQWYTITNSFPYSMSSNDKVLSYNGKIHVYHSGQHMIWDENFPDVVQIKEVLPNKNYLNSVFLYDNKVHMIYGQRLGYYTYEEMGTNYFVDGTKSVNCHQDALTLFNSTEVGFENENDGFSNNCENKQLPIFTDNISRIKKQDGVDADWWTTTSVDIVTEITNEETGEITTETHTELATISAEGTLTNSEPNVEKGVCFGFNI